VLNDVSVSVERGAALALIGPNGSGKTLLLHTLGLTSPPESGTVRIDGQEFIFPEAQRPNPQAPWPKVSVVFQQLHHWPHLTFRQAFDLVLKRNPNNRKWTQEVVERLGVASLMDRYPQQCSLGQKQRMAIVRAVMQRPDYLLADEPTSALDIRGALSVAELFIEMKKEGTGIVTVTHQIGFASRLADKIGFMETGNLIEVGDRELLRNPRLSETREFLELMTTL
jgi:ABC-type multidrug transport system ATPase subunit